MQFERHHATLFVDPAVSQPIEDLRRAWDPEMARQIAAHVTLVYPWEAPDPKLILEWLHEAADGQAPFRLRLGQLERFDSAEGVGCGFTVMDVDGGHSALRARISSAAFDRGDVDPHVTVVHPRTSSRGDAAWTELKTQVLQLEFVVRDVAVTASDGRLANGGADSAHGMKPWASCSVRSWGYPNRHLPPMAGSRTLGGCPSSRLTAPVEVETVV